MEGVLIFMRAGSSAPGNLTISLGFEAGLSPASYQVGMFHTYDVHCLAKATLLSLKPSSAVPRVRIRPKASYFDSA